MLALEKKKGRHAYTKAARERSGIVDGFSSYFSGRAIYVGYCDIAITKYS